MPKLTPEQRAELERQLADDDDGDDFEFHLTEGDRSVSLPWSRRESLGELGFTAPKKAPAAPKDGAGPKDKPRNVSVFGPRQRSGNS